MGSKVDLQQKIKSKGILASSKFYARTHTYKYAHTFVTGFVKRDQNPQKSKIELASPRYST